MNPSASSASRIHPTAIVHPSARIADGVEIGPYAVIGPEVEIAAGVWIGSHAVVEFATIGRDCKIHPHAFVGTPPQDLKYKGEKTRAVLGERTIVRECVTINRGTDASGVTRVGNNCLIMAYCHVAHDCVLGDNVIMANLATLAGHVDVANDVVMGGFVAVHQFTRIGFGAMLGGASKVASDVAPFCMTHGDRAVLVGLNVVGLRRRGLSAEALSAVKSAYKTVFLSGLTLKEALGRMESSSLPPEAKTFVDFCKAPSRGLCRPARGADAGGQGPDERN
ncbi:MAG: acyl-ACP--UDP-N-acetylglucosamine O-acyltransferase [Elusimicrobiota bacterium]